MPTTRIVAGESSDYPSNFAPIQNEMVDHIDDPHYVGSAGDLADGDLLRYDAATGRLVAVSIDELATMRVFNVKDKAYGAVGDGVADDTAAIVAAMDAATAAGLGRVVWFPEGVYLTTGISLSGQTCVLRGPGSDGLVIKGSSGHTGPIIDFTGYTPPSNMEQQRLMGGFTIRGDGVAGAAKWGLSMRGMSGLKLVDVSILDTGGRCADLSNTMLCDFERIVLNTPVDARDNNTPWLYAEGAFNGNRISGLGLRSIKAAGAAGGDTPAGGAVQIVADASYDPHGNKIDTPWVEFLHIPTNGTILHFAGNGNVIEDVQWFDVGLETGATGTSYVRFSPVTTGPGNYGNNIYRGAVPGTSQADCYGIELGQRGTQVIGPKGLGGKNVLIKSGVEFSAILLVGAESAATAAGVVDNSGANTRNYIIDAPLSTLTLGRGAGFDINNAAGSWLPRAVSGMELGGDGQRVQPSGTGLLSTADTFQVRSLALASVLQVNAAGFNPLLLLTQPTTGPNALLRARMSSTGNPTAFEVDVNGNVNQPNGNYIEQSERADPTAPAVDRARIYTRDNGAGKTQLCVLFNTGAVQVIATEP